MAKTLIHVDNANINTVETEWETHPYHPNGTTNISSGGPYSDRYWRPGFGGNFEYLFSGISSDTWIVNFQSTPYSSASDNDLLYIRNNSEGVTHITIKRTVDSKLEVYRGATKIAETATGVFPASNATWVHIQLLVKIDDVSGAVRMKLDDTLVIDFDGDTKNGGTSSNVDSFQFRGYGSYAETAFWTATTALVTELPGITRSYVMSPLTDDSIQYTRSSGSDSSNLIDETNYSETDYVESSTVGHADKFNMTTLDTAGGTILGVESRIYHQKTDAGARTARFITEISSTDYEGADLSPATTFSEDFEVEEVSPATAAAFTDAELNGAKHGFTVEA